MGWNTTVLILNDCFSEIERNPEQFVKELKMAINSMQERRILGQTIVTQTHHADDIMVYAVGRNSITNISVIPKKYDEYLEQTCKTAKVYLNAVMKKLLELRPKKSIK